MTIFEAQKARHEAQVAWLVAKDRVRIAEKALFNARFRGRDDQAEIRRAEAQLRAEIDQAARLEFVYRQAKV